MTVAMVAVWPNSDWVVAGQALVRECIPCSKHLLSTPYRSMCSSPSVDTPPCRGHARQSTDV